MQKREEAAISLAVSAAPGQVVEPPSYGEPVSPRPAQIWLIAAFLGLALPVGLLFLLESLHDKIQDESEILDETNVPVLGVLAKTRGRDKLVARENNFGVSAEMFRLLRSNLSQPSHKNLRTLLITSSIYGEGKSYIALNLAMTQVLVGKRVVIVDLDFRKKKPELYGSVAAGQFGVTDYLMNPAMTPQHLIHNSALHACLDIVHRGAVVPNPSQMVHSARLRELIHHLRQEYDFIILDAPPVGLITDTLEMNDLADATMYVVRAGKTQKNHLQIIENIRRMEKLPAPFIVLNGVRMNSSFHYANVFKAQNLSMDNNGNGVYVGKKQALSNN
jgi:capsular exopolysaccharide synthesis family protein